MHGRSTYKCTICLIRCRSFVLGVISTQTLMSVILISLLKRRNKSSLLQINLWIMISMALNEEEKMSQHQLRIMLEYFYFLASICSSYLRRPVWTTILLFNESCLFIFIAQYANICTCISTLKQGLDQTDCLMKRRRAPWKTKID